MKEKLIGKKVSHKKWGNGIITNIDDNNIYLDFNGIEKTMSIFAQNKPVTDFLTFEEKDKLIIDEFINEKRNIFNETISKNKEEIEKKVKENKGIETYLDSQKSNIRTYLKRNNNYSLNIINTNHCLKTGDPLDTSAYRIYGACVKEFNWDICNIGQYATQKGLFSTKATPEGYSVWMVSHSKNYDPAHKGKWTNEVCDGINTIIEEWKNDKDPLFEQETSTRVVFWKTKYCYEFLGIYVLDSFDHSTKKRTYKLVSDTYPEIK